MKKVGGAALERYMSYAQSLQSPQSAVGRAFKARKSFKSVGPLVLRDDKTLENRL